MPSPIVVSISRVGLFLVAIGAWACSRAAQGPSAELSPQFRAPSRLRVVATGEVAGTIEPCGCVEDQLGGLDRFATAVQKASRDEPTLVLEAGALFFPKAKVDAAEQGELLWRAEILAKTLRSLKAFAWAPGSSDTAFGTQVCADLSKRAAMRALPAPGPNAPIASSGFATPRYAVTVLNGVRIGIFGSTSKSIDGSTDDISTKMRAAAKELDAQGARLKIALLSMPPSKAVQAVEKVPAFQLVVIGGSEDVGMGADSDGAEPQMIATTLVVQPPNHLRGFVSVDFTVRDGIFTFQDATGVGRNLELRELSLRIAELTERVQVWKRQNQAATLLAAREADLKRLSARYAELSKPVGIPTASYFTVQTTSIGKDIASDPEVRRTLDDLGRRINQTNRDNFAHRKAPPAAPDQSAYVGVSSCETCHAKPAKFWRTTRHARAYQTLVDKDRQFTLECVGCHVTGYEQPGGSSVTDVATLQNVQCENCHGPGSIHAKTSAKNAITRVPNRQLCATRCHHSPNAAPNWSVDDAWPRILGPGHGQ